MLPPDFPPWQTVYGYFYRWRDSELFSHINATLREQVRLAQGRQATPSAAIIDSQSVKKLSKVESEVMTQARRSTGANAILSLTRWGCC